MKTSAIIHNPNSPLLEIQGTRAADRTGRRYGRLTALEPTSVRQSGSVVWRCRCDCGSETLVSSKNLATGRVASCGCLRRERMASRATDHAGKRYGKLMALEPVDDRKGGGVVWRCRCDCGNEVFVRGNYLSSGESRSCGRCSPQEKNRVMKYVNQLVRTGVDPEVILFKLEMAAMIRGVNQ